MDLGNPNAEIGMKGSKVGQYLQMFFVDNSSTATSLSLRK